MTARGCLVVVAFALAAGGCAGSDFRHPRTAVTEHAKDEHAECERVQFVRELGMGRYLLDVCGERMTYACEAAPPPYASLGADLAPPTSCKRVSD